MSSGSRFDPWSLPTLPRGQLPADHYARVTEAARRLVNPPQGYSDQAGTIFHPPTRPTNRIQIVPTVDLPQYSITQIVECAAYGLGSIDNPAEFPTPIGTPQFSDMPEFQFTVGPCGINPITPSATYTPNYYGWGYVINQDAAINAGQTGYGTLMIPGMPYIVRCAVDLGTGPTESDGVLTGGMVGTNIPDGLVVNANYGSVETSYLRDLQCISDPFQPYNSTTGFCGIRWVPWIRIDGVFIGVGPTVLLPPSGITDPPQTYNPDAPTQVGLFAPLQRDTTQTVGTLADNITPLQLGFQGFTLSGQLFWIINRDPSLIVPVNTYGHIYFMNNEWQPVWVAC